MQQKEPHLTTAHIALTCSVMGWLSCGLIAIPGVMIAHAVPSRDPATAVAVKAAFRVGYASILAGVAGLTTVVLTYLGWVSRLRSALGLDDASPGAFAAPEVRDGVIAQWTWIGGIFLATVIAFSLLLPLIRKSYNRIQSERILRNNSAR